MQKRRVIKRKASKFYKASTETWGWGLNGCNGISITDRMLSIYFFSIKITIKWPQIRVEAEGGVTLLSILICE